MFREHLVRAKDSIIAGLPWAPRLCLFEQIGKDARYTTGITFAVSVTLKLT